jgi:K+-sensing histidine kinase KdpD
VRQIDGAQGRDQLLEVVREQGRQMFSFEIFLLNLFNKSRSHYVVHALSPVAEATELGTKHFNLEEGLAGWVISSQSSYSGPIHSAPVHHPAFEGRLDDFGVRSCLAVPLQSGDETIGSVLFGSVKEDAFGPDDEYVGKLWGAHVGTALKHLVHFEDSKKRISQIELINDISRKLTSELELDELLKIAAHAIQRSFHYFDVTIFLLDPMSGELTLEAHTGNYADFLPHGYRQPLDRGLVGWVASHGEKILSNDVSLDPRYITYEYHNTKSELALPIRTEGQVVGVLNVEDTVLHAFDDMDAMVLETLCDQLGTAIRNARLYGEVLTANMKLTELDKMKSEFVGIVSHDFRSPLSSIILAAKSLLRHDASAGDKRLMNYLQIIVDQAMRLTRLAEDTLSITKIEAGQLNFDYKIVNMDRLIQDALSIAKVSKYHTVEAIVDPEALFIKADQSKLRQVIQNLGSNAVKYSPRGGKITLKVINHSPEEIMVTISDEGIGIPRDQIDNLFQKFVRITSGEAREIKGTGLGLWICKEIIQAHGGKIWVESDIGKGSTFIFTVKRTQ